MITRKKHRLVLATADPPFSL